MSYTALIAILIGCTLCYIFQGFFGKLFAQAYSGPDGAATPVFASIYGLLVSALVYIVCARFRFEPSGATIWLGLINGFILFMYNLSLINAAQRGPYAFQTIMGMCGSVTVLLLVDMLYWHDEISTLRLIGVGIMLAAIFVINGRGMKFEGIKRGYLFWVIMLFSFNGVYGVLLDAQQRVMLTAQRNEMIIITFFTSAVVSAVYLIATQHGRLRRSFATGRRALLYAVGASVSAAAAVYQFMILFGSELNSSIVNTVTNGGVLAGSVLLSAVALKEKLTVNMIIGILMIMASIVLLAI